MKTIVSKTAQDVSGGYQRWLVTYSDGTTEIFSLNLASNKWTNSSGQTVNPDTGEIIVSQESPFGPDFGPPQETTGVTGATGATGTTGPVEPVTPTGPTVPALDYNVPAFEVFSAYVRLAGITDEAMIKDIYNAATPYFKDNIPASDILDLMAASGTAPASFQAYIKNFNVIKNQAVGITTIREWNIARDQYRSLLSQFGLSNIATDNYADQFLMNNVSVQEAADRMNVAFNRIKYADEALKQQLKTYFPSLSDTDIAANILGVGKTVGELQKQIGVSEIKAEAATAGLTGTLTAEELFSQGVSRQQARQGYQEVKATKGLAEAAATRAGQSPSDIQTELEKESLLGLRSKRRAQLAAREQAYFAGKSGTAQVSLGGSTSGAF